MNAQVTRAGQFTVDAVVSTPAGGVLGPPSHLKVRSTAYGTITAWLTAIAGGLLVLLAARRVWRRVRGEAERPTARVAPTPPPTVDQPADPTGPTVRLPIPSHGPAPPDRVPRRTPAPAPDRGRQSSPARGPQRTRDTPDLPPTRRAAGAAAHGPPAAPRAAPGRPASAPATGAPAAPPPLVAAPEDVAPTERLPRPPPPRSRP